MVRMVTKNHRIEPAVQISRKCFACGESFTLSHPNSPRLLCEKCETALGDMIMEYRNEQQEIRNTVRAEDMSHAQP